MWVGRRFGGTGGSALAWPVGSWAELLAWRGLASEVGGAVRVACVSPGPVESDGADTWGGSVSVDFADVCGSVRERGLVNGWLPRVVSGGRVRVGARVLALGLFFCPLPLVFNPLGGIVMRARGRLVVSSVVLSLVASALSAGVVTATASAAPPPVVKAAAVPAPAAVASTESFARPDLASAQLAAKLLKHRIEVTGLESESDTTWVNPNGTLTTDEGSAPVREQVGGVWEPVDTTLHAVSGGFAPKVAKSSVVFSGGGRGQQASRLTVGKRGLGFGWSGVLPKPVVSGSTATYRNVQPGVNLVLTAGVDGDELSLVLTRRPSGVTSFQIPLTLSGLSVAQTSGGGLRFTDSSGQPVALSGSPQMWGAARDPHADMPTRSAPVATRLVGSGAAAALEVDPSVGFLTDPTVTYPVTIDPGTSLTETGYTYVSSAASTTSFYDNTTVEDGVTGTTRVGTYNGGGDVDRAFYGFDPSPIQGTHVLSATFTANQVWSYSCTPEPIQMWDSSGTLSSSVTWNNQPTVGELWDTESAAHGFSAACPSANVSFNATAMAQSWVGTRNTFNTVELRSPDETNNLQWAKFAGTSATLSVTYNSYPSTPANVSLTPIGPGQLLFPGQTVQSGSATDTTTPTITVSSTDADGGYLRLDFDVWSLNGVTPAAEVASGQVGGVPSGASSSWKVPAGLLSSGVGYAVRVQAFDGTDYGTWSSWSMFVVDTTLPAAPTGLASIYFAQNDFSSNEIGYVTWSQTDIPGQMIFDFYSLDNGPYTQGLAEEQPSGQSDTGSVQLSAPYGAHELDMYAEDPAGNKSATVVYKFYTYNHNTAPALLISPAAAARTSADVTLTSAAAVATPYVTYSYSTDGSTYTPVPTAQVTVAGTATTPPAWPIMNTTYPNLVWNMAATVGVDGGVFVKACFYATVTATSCTATTATVVQLTSHAFGDSYATRDVGPGSVSLLTGDFEVTPTDVSVATYDGTLSFGRALTTQAPAPANTLATGVFGPGWTAAFYGPAAGRAQDILSSSGNNLFLSAPDGSGLMYALGNSGVYVGLGDAAGEVITRGPNTFTLAQTDGTRTTWTVDGTGFEVTSITQPNGDVTAFSYDTVGRVSQITAPSTCSYPQPCEDLQFTYATATTASGSTFGDYTGRLSGVSLVAYDPATTSVRTVQVEQYTYDATGVLRQAWDPRISPALKTVYAYNASGRLATLTPPGLSAWSLSYDSKNRLASVSRPNPSGGTATTTMAYGVPVTGTGAPVDVGATAAATWGQTTDLAVTGTAVFDPDHVPAATPTTADWPYAELVYLDANGREVDTAEYGVGAWQVAATRYDAAGNALWSLTAGNRAQALTPTSATDPAVVAMPSSADRANALATISTYSADLTELLTTLGPAHPVTVNHTNNDGRSYTANGYDNSPDVNGNPYRLLAGATTSTQTLDGVDWDPVTEDESTYAALEPGDTSGEVLREPTSVTSALADGTQIVTQTRYNAHGQVIETREPMASTTMVDAHTTLTTYYSATGAGLCYSSVETGLVCQTGPEVQSNSGKPMPVTSYTYNMYDEPLTTTAISDGVTRTTTDTYDGAGRKTSEQITVTPAGVDGAAVPAQTFGYSSTTGLPTTTTSSAGVVTTGYDALGRVISYTDAAGATTTTSYDIDGRKAKVVDPKATTTYSYDGTTGEHRGLLTGLTDSQAGSFAGTYDAAGNLITQTYPGGLVATANYDNAGNQTSVNYTDAGVSWLDFTSTRDTQNRIASTNNAAGVTTSYGYDGAGRLTSATDNTGSSCAVRSYGYNLDSDRTSLTTSRLTYASGSCVGTLATPTANHAYDDFDQLTDPGYSYDDFGNTTTVPSVDAGSGGALSIGYYSNNLVNTISQTSSAGVVSTKSYGLDPTNRVLTETATNTTPVVTVPAAITVDTATAVNATWGQTTISTPAFSTTQAGDLLVALCSAGNTPTMTVSGGGLSWTLAVREHATGSAADAEIWTARATGVLNNVVIQAASATDTVGSQLTVEALRGASGVGGTGSAVEPPTKSGSINYAPQVGVGLTAAGSWALATGGAVNDEELTTPIAMPAGESVLHEDYDQSESSDFWAQATTTPLGAAGTGANFLDTAPEGQAWDMAAVEITPAVVVAPPAPVSGIQLLTNTGFELPLASTGEPAGAIGETTYGNSTITADSTAAHSGSRSLKVVTNSTTQIQGFIQYPHTLAAVTPANTKVQGSMWVKAAAGTILHFGLRAMTPDGSTLISQGAGTTVFTATGSWQQVSTAVVTVPQDAVIGIQCRTDTAVSGLSFWADDTSLLETPTVLTDHYGGSGDSPSWTSSSDGSWTREVQGLDGNTDAIITEAVGATTPTTTLQLADLHGDIAGTTAVGGTGLSATYTYDEFGNPTDANSSRYGWLGGKERAQTGIGDITLMGERLYNPATGRFLQTDPIPGGSANAYDYANQDPINMFDLEGTCPWGMGELCHVVNHRKTIGETVGKVAGYASFVPGPFGEVAQAVSIAGYATAGDWQQVAEGSVNLIAGHIGGKLLKKMGSEAFLAAEGTRWERRTVQRKLEYYGLVRGTSYNFLTRRH